MSAPGFRGRTHHEVVGILLTLMASVRHGEQGGAGDENRTRMASLEDLATIMMAELH
ncbi:MAG: hypothetical protein LC799_04750 [Actinobacteria bacterium]|nr:hypothetical protein [Actinomycetota bacterium]